VKIAYFVMGPESSGNRMMTKAIESAHDFGDGGYNLPLSRYDWKEKWKDLSKAPERITFVRSIPTGSRPNKEWFPIAEECMKMESSGYRILPIVLHRDIRYTVLSQLKHGHVLSHKEGAGNISQAYEHIFDQLSVIHLFPIVVKYERFVTSEVYRKILFENIGLEPPQMEFFNANEQY